MAAGDATYATQAEFEAYVEGWTTTNDAALKRLLQRAERDIDHALGNWSVESNGLKFGSPKTTNEKALTDAQVAALSRATCAQAEYRNVMGEEFFVKGQFGRVSGPDFTTEGALPYIGPKVYREVEGYGLLRRATTGSIRTRSLTHPPADYGDRLVNDAW